MYTESYLEVKRQRRGFSESTSDVWLRMHAVCVNLRFVSMTTYKTDVAGKIP
jgi:hypothetical protein